MNAHEEITRDFEFFKDCKAQRFKFPTSQDMEDNIKRKQMQIVIAGQMNGDLKRNNENVFSRSLLFIDFDDVNETEETFLKKINEKLSQANFCLYPTLKYKPEAIRYRLVLELSRPVNSQEYETLLFGICKDLGISFQFDSSNKTWSQGQGLPVTTEYSKNVKRIYYDDRALIPVDDFIKKIKPSWKKAKSEANKIKSGPFVTKGGNDQRKYTGIFLEELFNGTSQGNRNTWLFSQISKMLNLGTPVETIKTIIETINENAEIFPQPLDEKEIGTIYLSAIKQHSENGGDLY